MTGNTSRAFNFSNGLQGRNLSQLASPARPCYGRLPTSLGALAFVAYSALSYYSRYTLVPRALSVRPYISLCSSASLASAYLCSLLAKLGLTGPVPLACALSMKLSINFTFNYHMPFKYDSWPMLLLVHVAVDLLRACALELCNGQGQSLFMC